MLEVLSLISWLLAGVVVGAAMTYYMRVGKKKEAFAMFLIMVAVVLFFTLVNP